VPGWAWALLAVVALYALLCLALVAAGRRSHARALAGFIPDCVVLFKRLLGDPRVSRRQKWLVMGLIAYLAMPIDLVPDFIPVAGQLDDVLVVALVLRTFLRAVGVGTLREQWPGPDRSLDVVLRAAGRGGSANRRRR
jgi:uncharacterized membrane protein YkvA (DUF1232 family)